MCQLLYVALCFALRGIIITALSQFTAMNRGRRGYESMCETCTTYHDEHVYPIIFKSESLDVCLLLPEPIFMKFDRDYREIEL